MKTININLEPMDYFNIAYALKFTESKLQEEDAKEVKSVISKIKDNLNEEELIFTALEIAHIKASLVFFGERVILQDEEGLAIESLYNTLSKF